MHVVLLIASLSLTLSLSLADQKDLIAKKDVHYERHVGVGHGNFPERR